MYKMFYRVRLPTKLYSALLIRLVENSGLSAMCILMEAYQKYNSSGRIARQILHSQHSWMIRDGGFQRF